MARLTARGLLGIVAVFLTACAASAPAQSPAPANPATAKPKVEPPASVAQTTPPTPASAVRAAPTRPAAPILWKTVKLRDVEYVDLRDLAKAFDLKAAWGKSENEVTFSEGKTVRFLFEANQKDFYLDGLRIFLGVPALKHKDSLWISQLDVVKIVAPLIRPAAHREFLPVTEPKLIVIDAGHGGIDPGTQNEKLKLNEKTFTLDVSLRLAKLLEARGWKVALVREKDVEISKDKKADLLLRNEFANKKKADLYLSIHFNSAGPAVSGVETYSLAPQFMLSAGDETGDEMTKAFYPGNKQDYANMLLGEQMHRSMITGLKTSDRGLKHARKAVLRMLDCPGVLVECAYLSNDAEARRVATPEFRQQIAESLAAGLQNYSSALVALRAPSPPTK